MKYLVRGNKGKFLEAKLIQNTSDKVKIEPTDIEVDPRRLIHFGTDTIDEENLINSYLKKMEEFRVDYLFISPEREIVNNMQNLVYNRSSLDSKYLITVTAYLKR